MGYVKSEMAASTTYYECFNNKLDELLGELSRTFTEMSDIKILRNGLTFARTLDLKMPQSMFDRHVTPAYEKRIIDEDEQFFLHEEDYHAIASEHGVDLDIIGQLKSIWKDLDGENKQAIWKYLKVLVLLNRKCKSG
jgi:DNA-binding transcriptional ArsR family regulator